MGRELENTRSRDHSRRTYVLTSLCVVSFLTRCRSQRCIWRNGCNRSAVIKLERSLNRKGNFRAVISVTSRPFRTNYMSPASLIEVRRCEQHRKATRMKTNEEQRECRDCCSRFASVAVALLATIASKRPLGLSIDRSECSTLLKQITRKESTKTKKGISALIPT